jgi:hypothetical protein
MIDPQFHSQISDSRFHIPDFRFQIPDFIFQISDFRFQIPDLINLIPRARGGQSGIDGHGLNDGFFD